MRLTPATRIVLNPASARSLQAEAEVLAEELVAEGHLSRTPPVVVSRESKPHDIVLRLGTVEHADSREAYSIVADEGITITSPTADGAFWGTRTLVQVLRGSLPVGRITDWPTLTERALMLDIGRKYFTPDWIKALIREMSFLKMNALQLHLSEGLGFRVECETHPEIVSEEHLTKAEVREILAFAKRYHVHVNADVDTPGHMDHILSTHPEYQLVLANGTRQGGYLDFSNPDARRLVREIVGEMCDLFDGPVFHLGGDEFFPAPWQGTGPDTVSDLTAPQLVHYARDMTGNTSATAHDGYNFYLNELIGLVRAKGKVARMFNDDIYPGTGVNPVDPRTQADVWIRWNSSKPNAEQFVDAGHEVINSNGDYLYFILTSNGLGLGPNKNPEGIYERWTPRTFMGAMRQRGRFPPAGGQAGPRRSPVRVVRLTAVDVAGRGGPVAPGVAPGVFAADMGLTETNRNARRAAGRGPGTVGDRPDGGHGGRSASPCQEARSDGQVGSPRVMAAVMTLVAWISPMLQRTARS